MTEREVSEPAFAGRVGVGRRDITPPVGIYSRNWGAAVHDTAEGVHQPLLATALALSQADGDPLVLLTLDLGWWRAAADEHAFVTNLSQATEVPPDRLLVALSHTHAGPSVFSGDTDKPGGRLIPAYRERLEQQARDACLEAIRSREPAVITWGTGHCDLATHRDFFDGSRYVCGFDPDGRPDTTVLVGRVTDAGGGAIATILNYACHPTTLGPLNRQLSPDYIGAAREVVEGATGGVPCLFLQGASGELGPREGFSGDLQVADRNGRTLGWATLATISNLLPPATGLGYRGPLESGATLAIWQRQAAEPSTALEAGSVTVELPLKDRAAIDRITASWMALDDRVRLEREARRAALLASLPGDSVEVTTRIWRIGDALLVALGDEGYSAFQRELRAAVPRRAVLVAGVAGGPGHGYLPPDAAYDHEADLYQVWQTPFGRGALELLTERVRQAITA
jgi:hypothetical protein